MENRGFIVTLMVLFLGFSYLLISSSAVPATRGSLITSNEQVPVASFVQDLLAQDIRKSNEGDDRLPEKYSGEYESNEKLLLETTNDYPGTGPNPKHDPPPPAQGL